jgi:hypothetical protein
MREMMQEISRLPALLHHVYEHGKRTIMLTFWPQYVHDAVTCDTECARPYVFLQFVRAAQPQMCACRHSSLHTMHRSSVRGDRIFTRSV